MLLSRVFRPWRPKRAPEAVRGRLHRRLARLQLSPEPEDDDPQAVAEYVADIFTKLEEDEACRLPPQFLQVGFGCYRPRKGARRRVLRLFE